MARTITAMLRLGPKKRNGFLFQYWDGSKPMGTPVVLRKIAGIFVCASQKMLVICIGPEPYPLICSMVGKN
jgi:hypothetical protein